MLSKLEIARRQLGTALALYLQDSDPVSVHCLVCGGCEIAEHLTVQSGNPPMREFALAANAGLDEKAFRRTRDQFWNAFKHSSSHKGVERDDTKLLSTFSEQENEERLFVVWFDYGNAAGSLPIEAQVYSAWLLARMPILISSDVGEAFLRGLEDEFPNLSSLPRDRQRQRLKRHIDKCRKDRVLMADPLTDRRPLMLGKVL